MGFEHYRVELSGGRVTFRETDETLRQIPHLSPDPDAIPLPASAHYVLKDGIHVFEIELLDVPVRLSCRFTLSHPSSVVPTFLRLVRQLMERFGMAVTFREEVRPEHRNPFTLAEFAEFADAASGYIDARRAEWAAMFGDQLLAGATNEVYRQIILPQCKEAVEQPT
jgi:hypothetical protein